MADKTQCGKSSIERDETRQNKQNVIILCSPQTEKTHTWLIFQWNDSMLIDFGHIMNNELGIDLGWIQNIFKRPWSHHLLQTEHSKYDTEHHVEHI